MNAQSLNNTPWAHFRSALVPQCATPDRTSRVVSRPRRSRIGGTGRMSCGSRTTKKNPPVADGRRVSVPDTDHLWGHGGNPKWVWKCFTRGHNPSSWIRGRGSISARPRRSRPGRFTGGISKDQRDYPDWEPTRRAMGDTRRYAQRMNLADMTPRPRAVLVALLPRKSGRRILDLSA